MPKRLLLIDDGTMSSKTVCDALEAARYEVVCQRETPVEGVAADLVITLEKQHIPALRRQLPRPFLLLQERLSPIDRLRALRGRAREALDLALGTDLLIARIRGILQDDEARREYERRRVTASSLGFAEDATAFGETRKIAIVGSPTLAQQLGAHIAHRVIPMTSEEALDSVGQRGSPDAYAVTLESSGNQKLLPELRDRGDSLVSPILAIYPAGYVSDAVRALDLGAAEIAADDAEMDELALRLNGMLGRRAAAESLRRADEHSRHLASVDPLTGLYNRRYAEAYLNDVMSQRNGPADVTVMMIDIDHFKSINDTHGHPAGDRVLAEVADRIRNNVRAVDLVARYGGEEFLLVMPETPRQDAEIAAERIRQAVCNRAVSVAGTETVDVTVSIGAAVGRKADLVIAADAALYRAKASGRNAVDVSRPAA